MKGDELVHLKPGVATGHIEAYRVWRIKFNWEWRPRLVSTASKYVWEPGVPARVDGKLWKSWDWKYIPLYSMRFQLFRCLTLGLYVPPRYDPRRLGIMSCKDLGGASAAAFIWGGDLWAIGKVSLWGEIYEHEGGYRSQFAYPKYIIGCGGVSFYKDIWGGVPACCRISKEYGLWHDCRHERDMYHISTATTGTGRIVI